MSTNTKSTRSEKPQSEDDFAVTSSGQQDYLINYRNGLWTSIRQKENGIWQFISFYAAAIVLIVGFVQNESFFSNLDITRTAILSIAITAVSFWGITIILDANFWSSRNLWIISNIERKFLGRKGIGRILPAYYTTPNFHYTRLYSVHIYFLLLFVALTLLGNLALLHDPKIIIGFQEKTTISLMSIILLGFMLYSLGRDEQWVKQYYYDRALATGDRSDFVNYAEYYQSKNTWESPLRAWIFGLSLLLFLVLTSSLETVLGARINGGSYGLFVIINILCVAMVLWLRQIALGKYAAACKSYLSANISEEELQRKPEYKKLRVSAELLHWIIIGTNVVSFVIILTILFYAFWR